MPLQLQAVQTAIEAVQTILVMRGYENSM